jgi:hypothetical protein
VWYWCSGCDSNAHCARFERAASCRWATGAEAGEAGLEPAQAIPSPGSKPGMLPVTPFPDGHCERPRRIELRSSGGKPGALPPRYGRIVVRRPCRNRTGLLQIESLARYHYSNGPCACGGAEGTRTPHLRPARSALFLLSYRPMRPGPENRTRCLLFPKQAGQPSPSPRISPAGAVLRHRPGVTLAIHCGVFKQVPVPPAEVGGRAGVTGFEPATFGFGGRCAASCATPLCGKEKRRPVPVWVGGVDASEVASRPPVAQIGTLTGAQVDGSAERGVTHRTGRHVPSRLR